MKKSLLLVLAIVVSLGVTACVQPNEGNKEVNIEKQYIFGKVKNIVGNEIEFELAKSPDKDIKEVNKEEEEKVEMKDEMPALTTTPAMKGDKDDTKVSVGDIEENNPLVELEFTGELKTIILPTGIKINILSGRSGEGLSAIKEGTYLKLEVDDSKSEKPSVLEVDVIS